MLATNLTFFIGKGIFQFSLKWQKLDFEIVPENISNKRKNLS
jgi:hypothetical protein